MGSDLSQNNCLELGSWISGTQNFLSKNVNLSLNSQAHMKPSMASYVSPETGGSWEFVSQHS